MLKETANPRVTDSYRLYNARQTPLPTNIVTPNPLHTSLPAPVHICTLFVSYALFIYYFNCISFAIRLSGRKVAIKLIDIDDPIFCP